MLYAVGTNVTWTHGLYDIFLVKMVYVDENGKIMLHHPSLSKIKSQLTSSGSNESHKEHSTIVIKQGFYMGSYLDVTTLLRDGHFFKVSRNKFIKKCMGFWCTTQIYLMRS